MKLFTRSILLICLCFSAFFAKASASAHFTADVTSGCAPLLVHFTNTTTGASGSATYSWDLGNGTTSTLTDVSGSYIAAGTYTCTLTVTDGGVTTTYSMTITVFPAPTVDFVASDTAVCPGSTVSFTSTTLAGVPGALTYAWAFGDGHVSTSSSPSDLYSAPGYYNVTLSATNSDGCVASLTKTAYIHVYTPPVAAFTAPTVHFCGTPAHAVFTDASTGTGPFTYHWSFGDGSTGSGSPASHDYTSTGSYTVKLIVTDAHGCQDSISMPAYIYVGITTASFTGPTTACVHSYFQRVEVWRRQYRLWRPRYKYIQYPRHLYSKAHRIRWLLPGFCNSYYCYTARPGYELYHNAFRAMPATNCYYLYRHCAIRRYNSVAVW